MQHRQITRPRCPPALHSREWVSPLPRVDRIGSVAWAIRSLPIQARRVQSHNRDPHGTGDRRHQRTDHADAPRPALREEQTAPSSAPHLRTRLPEAMPRSSPCLQQPQWLPMTRRVAWRCVHAARVPSGMASDAIPGGLRCINRLHSRHRYRRCDQREPVGGDGAAIQRAHHRPQQCLDASLHGTIQSIRGVESLRALAQPTISAAPQRHSPTDGL